jgi:NAD+ synthase (glutamine-hydrolysing)
MKLGIAQLNTTVGDLEGNRRLILDAYSRLVADGAHLVLTHELSITGYPPRDLLMRRRFGEDCMQTLQTIAAATGPVPLFVGFVEPNPTSGGRPFYNSAAVCAEGHVQHVARKCLLPTYDVFDEDRYFEPAAAPTVVELGGKRIAITICEDIWAAPASTSRLRYHGIDPVRALVGQPLDLMVNLSSSPWNTGKLEDREDLIVAAARALGCPVAYCNLVGGNDELIFDGRSIVVAADGRLIAGMESFRTDSRIVDLAGPPSVAPTYRREEIADVFDALVLGTRDYAHKSGFRTAHVALSGGIDSAVVAVIAAEALGRENVTGVSLPSAISSQHSRDDARALAENLGIRFQTIPIADTVASAEASLVPVFEGRARDVAEENIQARIRGLLMMALSNKFGSILLTTGNKSEIAVGYCTLYGDMAGGLAVISDVFNTQVYALANWMNREREIIPANTIAKPPSAELRPGQVDQDSLPPYDVLDSILRDYVEEGLSRREIVARGHDAAVVNDIARKVDRNEYKRKQAAPGLRITPLAFGVGRRIPIVQKYVN